MESVRSRSILPAARLNLGRALNRPCSIAFSCNIRLQSSQLLEVKLVRHLRYPLQEYFRVSCLHNNLVFVASLSSGRPFPVSFGEVDCGFQIPCLDPLQQRFVCHDVISLALSRKRQHACNLLEYSISRRQLTTGVPDAAEGQPIYLRQP